jgi:predicted Zn-dependent protease
MMTILFAALLVQQDVAGLAQAGAQAMREQRFTEAAGIFRRLAAQQPGLPQWRLNLGLALHSAGDVAAAVPELERYVKAVPAPSGAHWLLGVDQLKLGKSCAAADSLTVARRWRASREVSAALADACLACKRYAEAAAQFEGLGQTRQAARARWLGGEYSKARSLYAGLAAQHEDDAEFAYEYGDTLLRVESAAAALPFLERARALPSGRAALGKALVQLERWAEAVPLLEEASRQDGALLLPLSRAYQGAGRGEEAARALAEFRKQGKR